MAPTTCNVQRATRNGQREQKTLSDEKSGSYQQAAESAPGVCLASLGSDPCKLIGFHSGPHRTFWGSRDEVAVIWSDGDGEWAHPDPRGIS